MFDLFKWIKTTIEKNVLVQSASRTSRLEVGSYRVKIYSWGSLLAQGRLGTYTKAHTGGRLWQSSSLMTEAEAASHYCRRPLS